MPDNTFNRVLCSEINSVSLHLLCYRCSFICCQQLLCVKTPKGLVMFALVWVLCCVFVPLVVAFLQELSPEFFVFLLAPVFIICLAVTLKLLPAATSVPVDEKHRTVGILVFLLIHNIILIQPTINNSISKRLNPTKMEEVFFVLFLLSPCMDLIFFFFMCKGLIDKLLMFLCCCWTEDVTRSESNLLLVWSEQRRDFKNENNNMGE